MTKQVYEFPNKTSLQDNDLFLISDESTANHDLKNISAAQAKTYLFPSLTNTFTPTFSNVTSGASISNIISIYLVPYAVAGNWVQVTMEVNFQSSVFAPSIDVAVPLGGNFINNNDAVFLGGAVYVPSNPTIASALSPFQRAYARVATNRVIIEYRINNSVGSVPVIFSQSFIYKIY